MQSTKYCLLAIRLYHHLDTGCEGRESSGFCAARDGRVLRRKNGGEMHEYKDARGRGFLFISLIIILTIFISMLSFFLSFFCPFLLLIFDLLSTFFLHFLKIKKIVTSPIILNFKHGTVNHIP
jgi:hypothetical protein